MLFASCLGETHLPTKINLNASNLAKAVQAYEYLSENWELLKNVFQSSQKQRHISGIKERRLNLPNHHYILESNSSSWWLPDHFQGQLNTSIRAKLLDKMVNKLLGCPKKKLNQRRVAIFLCCASENVIKNFIYLQCPSFKDDTDEYFQEKKKTT